MGNRSKGGAGGGENAGHQGENAGKQGGNAGNLCDSL